MQTYILDADLQFTGADYDIDDGTVIKLIPVLSAQDSLFIIDPTLQAGTEVTLTRTSDL